MSERFGNYELVRRIAQGGMAEVYLARFKGVEGFERWVVIKKMLPELAVRKDFVEMFLDEARLAARFNHPNIVQVFELGEKDGSYFMAMEFVDGPHLGALFAHSLRQKKALPLSLCCYVVARAAEGLHHAHELRDSSGAPLHIVHRDVSPQNILLSKDGDVKIMDFGVAKAATQVTVTRTGVVKGKVGYMSPEQCLANPIDRKTDVFALGIVLYELVTRRRLFRDKSDLVVMQKITQEDVPPPSTLNPRVPKHLDWIILRALQRDQERRTVSAQVLADELDEFMGGLEDSPSRQSLSRWMGENAAELRAGGSSESAQEAQAQPTPSWDGAGSSKPSSPSNPSHPSQPGRQKRSNASIKPVSGSGSSPMAPLPPTVVPPSAGTPPPGSTLGPPASAVSVLDPTPPFETTNPEDVTGGVLPPTVVYDQQGIPQGNGQAPSVLDDSFAPVATVNERPPPGTPRRTRSWYAVVPALLLLGVAGSVVVKPAWWKSLLGEDGTASARDAGTRPAPSRSGPTPAQSGSPPSVSSAASRPVIITPPAAPVELRFPTDPPNATVTVNDKPATFDEKAGIWVMKDVPLDKPSVVVVRAEGYQEQTKTYMPNNGTNWLPLIQLRPKPKPGDTSRLGTLDLVTDPPGARVSLDGKSLGKTPLLKEVGPGNRTVEFELAGYKSLRAVLRVESGRRTSNSYRLEKEGGGTAPGPGPAQLARVTIDSQPWTLVFINSRKVGQSPASIDVPVGKVSVRLVRNEKECTIDAERELEAVAGKVNRKRYEIVPAEMKGNCQ